MVEYIYFVKCPNCEDEHFDFFDEAKAFALGCLSKKPIITQTEVCRNDFGECTDHSDLGTIWSWEDMMNDENMLEPEASVFSKDNLKDYDPENDPEFQDDDFFAINSEEPVVDDLDEAAKVSFNNKADYKEFADLTSKIGIMSGEDLDRFMKEVEADDGSLLDKLRAYKADLGDDFKLKEEFISVYDYGRMTKDELYDHLVNKADVVEIDTGNQGYTYEDTGSFSDGGYYSNSLLSVHFEDGKFRATEFYMSESGDEKEGDWDFETESFDELWNQLMEFKPEGLVECSERKPIPEGMTLKELVEVMEEREDDVECTWCEDIFDKSECRYEVNLGWLCDRCQAAIMSRGEPLTFREGNYWDFLDESVALTEARFRNINRITDPVALIISDLEQNGFGRYLDNTNPDVIFRPIQLVDGANFRYGIITNLEVAEDGTVNIVTTYRTIDLDFARRIVRGNRPNTARALINAINDAVVRIDRAHAPTRAERAQARKEAKLSEVASWLNNNPEAVEELKNHIIDITFKAPLQDDYEHLLDDEDPDYERAVNKLERLRDNFKSLPFADEAIRQGVAVDRVLRKSDKYEHIASMWYVTGIITFDCPIGTLTKSKHIIEASRVTEMVSSEKSAADLDNATSANCFNLAAALIMHFGNDVKFFEKKDTTPADEEITEDDYFNAF